MPNEEHIKTIAQSINKEGYFPNKALLVNSRDGENRVIAGSNRLRAMRYLGRETVPCYVFKNLSDEDEAYYSELDNKFDETHKEIHFLDRAEAYKRLVDDGWTQEKIAKMYGVDAATVSRRIKIANMPDTAKNIIRGNLDVISSKSQALFKNLSQANLDASQFFETHFRDIINLQRPIDQIKVVAQIALSKGKLKGQKLKAATLRRHLTTSQRALLAVELEPMFAEEAKRRQGTRTDLKDNISVELHESEHERRSDTKAGRLFAVGHFTVSKAKKIIKTKPEVIEDIRQGKTTVDAATLRRHLTTSQRALLAVELEPMFAKGAEKRKLAQLKQYKGETVSVDLRQRSEHERKSATQAGKVFCVSESSVTRAKKIIHTKPEVIENKWQKSARQFHRHQ